MIECYKDRIWYQHQVTKIANIPVGSKMTIIKLDKSQLFIHSPIDLTPELAASINQLGNVAAVVTPNKNYHHYLSEWWLAYPEAYFFAPSGLQLKRSDLTFDDVLSKTSPALWHHSLLQTSIRGSDNLEEIAFCDPVSKTLILGDSLAWMIDSKNPLSIIFAIANGCYFHPAMPLYLRIGFYHKTQLRQSIQEILTWPFERIIFSRGKVIEHNGKEYFADAFAWLFNK
jgi:hypothetical protein